MLHRRRDSIRAQAPDHYGPSVTFVGPEPGLFRAFTSKDHRDPRPSARLKKHVEALDREQPPDTEEIGVRQALEARLGCPESCGINAHGNDADAVDAEATPDDLRTRARGDEGATQPPPQTAREPGTDEPATEHMEIAAVAHTDNGDSGAPRGFGRRPRARPKPVRHHQVGVGHASPERIARRDAEGTQLG